MANNEANVNTILVKEFRELGYLQELNRQFLHPLGLALSVRVEEDGTETLAEIWDCRHDPEGIQFDEFDRDKAAYVVGQQLKRSLVRMARDPYRHPNSGP